MWNRLKKTYSTCKRASPRVRLTNQGEPVPKVLKVRS